MIAVLYVLAGSHWMESVSDKKKLKSLRLMWRSPMPVRAVMRQLLSDGIGSQP